MLLFFLVTEFCPPHCLSLLFSVASCSFFSAVLCQILNLELTSGRQSFLKVTFLSYHSLHSKEKEI